MEKHDNYETAESVKNIHEEAEAALGIPHPNKNRQKCSINSITLYIPYIAPYRGPREVTDGLVGLIQI